VRAVLEAALLDPGRATTLGSALSDEELVEIGLRVLMEWCAWVDALRPTEAAGPDFLPRWAVERTCTLWWFILGVVRHAWDVPLGEQPVLPGWFPTGRDEKSVPSAFLDGVFRRIEQRPSAPALVEQLAAARPRGDGKAVKPATVASWRRGISLPNGGRVTAIRQVDGDRHLRVKLGVQVAVERLAALHAHGGQPSPQNRDATFLWLAVAEVRAHAVQKALVEKRVDGADALRLLGDARLLTALLPAVEQARR